MRFKMECKDTYDEKDLKEKLDNFVSYLKTNFDFVSLNLVVNDENGFVFDIEENVEERIWIVDIADGCD